MGSLWSYCSFKDRAAYLAEYPGVLITGYMAGPSVVSRRIKKTILSGQISGQPNYPAHLKLEKKLLFLLTHGTFHRP